MNSKAAAMKIEIRTIAGYRALIVSKFFMSLLLFLASLYLGYLRYALSPFYILLMLNILPPVLKSAFKEYALKNKLISRLTADEPFQLNILKTKYKYTKLSYSANTMSYLFALLLLCLWQYNYSTSSYIDVLVSRFPLFILISGVLLRFLGIVYYRLKFPFDLSHNKL
jgi:hypothetical protein